MIPVRRSGFSLLSGRSRAGPPWTAAGCVDRVLPDCQGYDDFLAKMRAEGYEIREGKKLSFRAVKLYVCMDMGLVHMGRHYKLVLASSKLHRQLIAEPVGILRADFPWLERLDNCAGRTASL